MEAREDIRKHIALVRTVQNELKGTDIALDYTKDIYREVAADIRTRFARPQKEGPRPASKAQKDWLDDLGVSYKKDITSKEASELLKKHKGGG